MFQKINIAFIIITMLLGLAGPGKAETISFTAGDIVNWLALAGVPLHKSSLEHGEEVWGLSRVRVIPEVSTLGTPGSPGGYTINIAQSGVSPGYVSWRAQTDAIGNPPYGDGVTNTGWHASFNDTHIYEWQGSWFYTGDMYLISDLNASDFAARFPSSYPGYSQMPIFKMPDNTRFTLNFTLNPGVTWLNQGFYFLVDGNWYNTWYEGASYTNPTAFTGGFGHNSIQIAGNLPGNMGYGYHGTVPLPGSLILLGSGLLGLAWVRLRRR
jgi:hypothetical protein